MKIKFLILFIFSFGLLSAQTKPTKCTAFLPDVLCRTTIFLRDVEKLPQMGYGQDAESTKKYWDAYSDRCDNVLYQEPNKKKPNGKTLNFNERVRIASIKNGFAEVFVEEKPGAVNYPNISERIQVKGWIPMENLLLWNTCPTCDLGIYRKALIVQNIDVSNDENFGKRYMHPEPGKDEGEDLISGVDFHYVMKEKNVDGNKICLIAKASKLDGYTDQLLEGWVYTNSFVRWNQRSCLEPNSNPDDVSYFKANNIHAQYYEEPEMKTTAPQKWVYGSENGLNQPATRFRMGPNTMRYPILDQEQGAVNADKCFKATFFGTPNGELGDMSTQAKKIDKQKKEKEEALKAAAQINIIIVIDGTRSMGKYFPVMANAIKEVNQFLGAEGKQEVKVGAVIYRDYADGDNVIEYHRMIAPTDPSIEKFFTEVGRNGFGAESSDADKTEAEALYYGLETALDYQKMGYKPENSNLLFVIGDCGNDKEDTRVTDAKLIEMADSAKVQLFTFQVKNMDRGAYNDFNNQLTNICRKLTTGKPWQPTQNGLKLRKEEGQLVASAINRAQANQELSENDLKTLIQDAFVEFKGTVDNLLATINDLEGGLTMKGGVKKGQVSMDHDYLRRKLGEKRYKAIVESNSFLAYTGYTPRDNGDGRSYWDVIVLLSTEELQALVAKLKPLKDATRTNTYDDIARNNYVKAIAGIIQSMTEKSAEEIEQMSTDEVTCIIGGLNVTTNILRGEQDGQKIYTLAEIKNRQACPDQDFKRIVRSMSRKIDDLSTLSSNSTFKYKFTQNGKVSYWLPLEYIP
jgi:hypothetical protein